MGKTFKYGYSGHSFRQLERHAEAKVGDRRKARRALKDSFRAELDDMDYILCNKFYSEKSGYSQSRASLYNHNSTASWNKLNANIVWEVHDEKLIGDTGENTVTIENHPYYSNHGNNFAYNIQHGRISKDRDLIGKKQLKRRNEIGKMSLMNRYDEFDYEN